MDIPAVQVLHGDSHATYRCGLVERFCLPTGIQKAQQPNDHNRQDYWDCQAQEGADKNATDFKGIHHFTSG
jgi:hypothetical protein